MSEYTRKDGIIRRVVSALQTAPTGSQELDCMISYALELARGEFDQVMMQLLVSEGYSWNVISEIWEGKVARYTQSLDCAVEGENIAFVMKSERRAQWAGVHKAADGTEYVAWARTEILARRLAALKGILAEAESRSGGPIGADDDDDVEDGDVDGGDVDGGDVDEGRAGPGQLPTVSAGGGAAREAESWSVLF